MSTGEAVEYRGRSEAGVHTFTAEGRTVTASKAAGWQCDCGRPDCEHVQAAKEFWRRQASSAAAEAAAAPAAPGPVRVSAATGGSLPVASAGASEAAPEWGDEVHLLNLVATLAEHVGRVADALEKLVGQSAGGLALQPGQVGGGDEAPDLEYPLSAYAGFDWPGIGAQLVSQDQDGATVVRWRGQLYKRRSPDNKFGKAIWFSRTIGKADDGTPLYERLVTFREISEPEPLPSKVAARVSGNNGSVRH